MCDVSDERADGRAHGCVGHISVRQAFLVYVKIDYTTGENVINSSPNKSPDTHNANSKNHGRLEPHPFSLCAVSVSPQENNGQEGPA